VSDLFRYCTVQNLSCAAYFVFPFNLLRTNISSISHRCRVTYKTLVIYENNLFTTYYLDDIVKERDVMVYVITHVKEDKFVQKFGQSTGETTWGSKCR
jgi:hypothetical protein